MNKIVSRAVISGIILLENLGVVNSSFAIDDTQKGAIAQNCGTIQQNLRNLQRVDSKTRTYLGSVYESVANDFLIPLNLRLVRNNQPEAILSNIQSDFTGEQLRFKSLYTEYMREMEALLATSCQSEPEKFYDQLQKTREKRQDLQKSTNILLNLTKEQVKTVKKIREEL